MCCSVCLGVSMAWFPDIQGTEGVRGNRVMCLSGRERAISFRHRDRPRRDVSVEDVWTLPKHFSQPVL